jgi:hypothetical protein
MVLFTRATYPLIHGWFGLVRRRSMTTRKVARSDVGNPISSPVADHHGQPDLLLVDLMRRQTGIHRQDVMATGISTADRARTISVAMDATKGPDHLVKPRHAFPLSARDGGMLVRAGYTEASVDIARFAGLTASVVICGIMNPHGSMVRLHELGPFAEKHGLKIGTVRELIAYRRGFDHLLIAVDGVF